MKLQRNFSTYDPDYGQIAVSWEPVFPRDCGWSYIYHCSRCGEVYARIAAWVGGTLVPFKAVAGCCLRCPGDRYYVPGSIETLTLHQWDAPADLLTYQCRRELDAFTLRHKEPSCL